MKESLGSYDDDFVDPPKKKKGKSKGLTYEQAAATPGAGGTFRGFNTGYGESKYDKNLSWDAEIGNNIQEGINEHRASEQSGWAQLGLGVGRAANRAAAEIAKMPGVVGGIAAGGIGQLGDLVTGEDNTDFVKTAFNNAWIESVEGISEQINTDLLPVYVSKAVKDGNLWDNITSTSFWATEGADGIGFIASMLAPGAIVSKFKLGEKFAGMLGKTDEAKKMLQSLGFTGKAANAKVAATANTIFEAGSEAGGAIRSYRESLEHRASLDPKDPNYINPQQFQELVAKEGEVGRNVFLSNMAILAGPNMMMSNMLHGAKNIEKLGSKLIDPNTGKLVSNVVDYSLKEKIGRGAKRVGEAFLSEGFFEEGLQSTSETYFKEKALNENNNKNFLEAYLDTLGTTEGQKAVFLGGVLGGGMTAYHGVKEDKAQIKQAGELLNKTKEGVNEFVNFHKTDVFKTEKVDDGKGGTREVLVLGKDGRPVVDQVKVVDKLKQLKGVLDDNFEYQQALASNNTTKLELLQEKAINNLVQSFIQDDDLGLEMLEQHLKTSGLVENVLENSLKPEEDKKKFIEKVMSRAKTMQQASNLYTDFKDVFKFSNEDMTDEDLVSFQNKYYNKYLTNSVQEDYINSKLKEVDEKEEKAFEQSIYNKEDLSPDNPLKQRDVLQDKRIKEVVEERKRLEKAKIALKEEQTKFWKEESYQKEMDKIIKERTGTEKKLKKAEKAEEILKKVKKAKTKKELEKVLLLPAGKPVEPVTPLKTAKEYNAETELLVIQDVLKSLERDDSADNLELLLDKLDALNITSPQISVIIDHIEGLLDSREAAQDAFKEELEEMMDYHIGYFDMLEKELSDTQDEIDELLKTQKVLAKSLAEQDKSPRGRYARIIKDLIKDAENELKRVDQKIKHLNEQKAKLKEELKTIEKEIGYIYDRLGIVDRVEFKSVKDIINYLNTNGERFKDHRKDYEKLAIHKFGTERRIEEVEDVIDSLESYKKVLEETISQYATMHGKLKPGTNEQDYKYIREELIKTAKALSEAKQDLKSEQQKLNRLSKSMTDKAALTSIKSEKKFWERVQKFKGEKVEELLDNPVIAEKIRQKREELELEEAIEAEMEAEHQLRMKEDQDRANAKKKKEFNPPVPPDPVDNEGDYNGEPVPVPDDEDIDEEVNEGDNYPEEDLDNILDENQAAAKVISTVRYSQDQRKMPVGSLPLENGSAIPGLENFVEYERTPRDKTNDLVTFSLGDKMSKEVERAYNKMIDPDRIEDLSPDEISLLEGSLPIKVTFEYVDKDKKTKKVSSFIESKTKANQSDETSKKMLEEQTMPLRRNIIEQAIENRSLEGIKGAISDQYPGLIKVDKKKNGSPATNNISDLQFFKDMDEKEFIQYFQRNTGYVNWKGSLVSTISPKKVIGPTFDQGKKGEIFLRIPQNNGEDFWLKLNVNRINEEKSEAVYEMIKALSEVSRELGVKNKFGAMTVGQFFDKLDESDPELSERLQKVLAHELKLVKTFQNDDERNESLSRFLDLIVYHKSENKKTAFKLQEDGSLMLGTLAGHLMDGQGFKHSTTITKEELDTPEAKEVIMKYLKYKRHNILVTKDNPGLFVFNNPEYVKYLLNKEAPLLTTNATIKGPTFQGYSNIYLNQNVKNSKSVAKKEVKKEVVQKPKTAKEDIERRRKEELNKNKGMGNPFSSEEENDKQIKEYDKDTNAKYDAEIAALNKDKETEDAIDALFGISKNDLANKKVFDNEKDKKEDPQKKEDVVVDTKALKELFNKANDDLKGEMVVELAEEYDLLKDLLRDDSNFEPENIDKTFDFILNSSKLTNKALDKMKKICGI